MTWRRGAFLLAGWLVVGVALSPPLDAAADESLPWHMLQHMLLLAVAPPLLVLGEPVRVAFDLLPPRRAQRLAGALRRPPLSTLLNPAVALALFFGIVLGTHVPAVFDTAIESDPLHALEHFSYLLAGLLLWSAAIGADPARKPLSIIGLTGLLTAAMVPMLAVGVALATASGVVYAPYAETQGSPAAFAEQATAATAMWAGDLPFIAALVLAGWAALRREERLQRLRELAADRESVKNPLQEEFSQTREGGRV
ncbi:MAG TPA: cytochrome c oxidase assembly protein [Solirubrobacterales bacterium]|nr:cytochrome c oxidase assembly protein [Solirubrobacterales bacterium]